jgi:hypothetical protein
LLTGDYALDPEHPPLGRVLATLPLLALHLDPKFDSQGWQRRDMVAYGRQLLYHQPRVRVETILLATRTPPILLTLTLTLLVAFWTRARFGPAAGLLAAALAALDPNLTVHGHLATTDFPAAFGAFLACVSFERMLRRRKWSDVVWAGLALGVALSAKYSALFLLPAFVIVVAMTERAGLDALKRMAGVFALSGVVLMLSFGTATFRMNYAPWVGGSPRAEGAVTALLGNTAPRDYVIRHPLWRGLNITAGHQLEGHHSYMLGEIAEGGRRDYFPFAFLVKTPLGTLLLFALTLPLLRRMEWEPQLALMVPLVVFWSVCISSRVNIGLRHLLPVYPLMFALAGGWFATRARSIYGRATPALVGLAVALLAFESVRIAPHELAFFNLAAGGPANGPALLVDSNLDWGQDIGNLRKWLGARSPKDVCLVYFGLAERGHYGFPECGLPTTVEIRSGYEPEHRWVAISATLLEGVYHRPEWYAWLRERSPVARVGWSIYVYDVNDLRPTARLRD